MDLQVRLFLFYDHLPNIDLCFVLVSESEDDVISNLFMLVFSIYLYFRKCYSLPILQGRKSKNFQRYQEKANAPLKFQEIK